jgi:acyl-CoA thioester hydrolase
MPGRVAAPTFAEVEQVPATYRGSVPAEYLDENDHMNIQFYLNLTAISVADRMRLVGLARYGIDRDETFSQFTAEHHLVYYSELRRGSSLSAHTRLVARSDKTLHSMSYLLDRDQERLAFTMELIALEVDMTTRRTAPFPEALAASIDAAILADSDYSWPNPLCGVMGARGTSTAGTVGSSS